MAAGAELKARLTLYIGFYEGSDGTLELRGRGSRLVIDGPDPKNQPALSAGHYGRGRVIVSDLAHIELLVYGSQHAETVIGQYAGSNGHVIISESAYLSTRGPITVAQGPGAHGTLEVLGKGSRLEAGSLVIAPRPAPDAPAAQSVQPDGIVTIDSALVEIEGRLAIGPGGRLLVRGGEIRATHTLLDGGLLTGSGVLRSQCENRGGLHIGPASLLIDGSYSQFTEGSLVVGLASNAADLPLLRVTGDARLGGRILIVAEGPIDAGQRIVILSAERLAGRFETAECRVSGAVCELEYEENRLVLEVRE